MARETVGQMTGTEQDAVAICERIAEETARALLARDFESFAAAYRVPTSVDTFEGRRTLETMDELEDAFEAVCDHYEMLAVTDLVRHVVAAAFNADGSVSGAIENRVLSGALLIQAPYVIYSTYVEADGRWKIAESVYVCDDAPGFTRALSQGRRQKTSAPHTS